MDNTQTPLPPFQQPEPAQKKGWGRKVALPALALLVLALGGVAYWQYFEANQANNAEQSATDQVTTLKSEVSGLKDQLQTATATAGGTTSSQSTSSTKTDDEMIIDTVTAYVHGQKGNADAKITVTIDKKQLPFARAQVGAGQTGYACILKKVDGSWLQLYCAQGASDFTQTQDETYEVPSSIVAS